MSSSLGDFNEKVYTAAKDPADCQHCAADFWMPDDGVAAKYTFEYRI